MLATDALEPSPSPLRRMFGIKLPFSQRFFFRPLRILQIDNHPLLFVLDRLSFHLFSSPASAMRLASSTRASVVLLLCAIAASADEPVPVAATNETAPTRRLIFVAELCRHGDRAPLAEFPADALPASKWPEGFGQLTAIGMRAHYELGARLRARYVDSGFLSPSYKPSEVHVRSTDVDRTLMSATSQLSGLFPPGTAANDDVRVRFGKDALHENEGGLPHLFQPIPVHTESTETDQLLLPGNYCPRHVRIMEEKRKSEEFQEVIERNKDFLKEAAKIAAWTKDDFTIFDLDKLYDTWVCFEAHSVPLPERATPDIIGQARNLSNWLLTFGNEGKEVHRLRAGLILHDVKTFMVAAYLKEKKVLPKTYNGVAKKFLFLSAHDTTVASTLAAMRVFNAECPPYNSTIIWELFQEGDESLSVRVEFNGKALVLPGCSDEYCPVLEYRESTKERTVPGIGARTFECLTGWRRYMAMAHHAFSRSKDDPLSSFGLPSEDEQPTSGFGVILSSLIALVVSTVGIMAIVRARSRYKGYVRAASAFKSDDYGLQQETVAERRILM